MKGITYTQVAQYCVLIFAYTVPAVFIALQMTGNPIPQFAFGTTLADGSTYLLDHLDERTDVQNIDLMNLAGFCRNCLSKWYVAAAEEAGFQIDYEAARERVYGMPYPEWKARYQSDASPEQLDAFQRGQRD